MVLRADRGLNMSPMGIDDTGAGGASYEVASVRVQVVGQSSGRVLSSSGTPEVPDLAPRFTVTP